jgi:hypothetical protein
MFSYEIYKVLHILGVLMVVTGLVSGSVVSWVDNATHPARKLSAMTSGIGLMIVLLAGFGMLARLQISPGQPWVTGKLSIWLLLGAFPVIARKLKMKAPIFWATVVLLASFAGYLAIYKPGA